MRANMHDTIDKTVEKIYIIQPITRENASKYKVLHAEAISLIESAGALYAGTIYQNVREINPATFVGEGKLAELYERLDGLEEITILFKLVFYK
jgi:50S ribosomal subunit-associated GTPase HflX